MKPWPYHVDFRNSVQCPLNRDVHLHKPAASTPLTASATALGLKAAGTVTNEGQPGGTGTYTDRAFDANAREWVIGALVFCFLAAATIVGAALGGLL